MASTAAFVQSTLLTRSIRPHVSFHRSALPAFPPPSSSPAPSPRARSRRCVLITSASLPANTESSPGSPSAPAPTQAKSPHNASSPLSDDPGLVNSRPLDPRVLFGEFLCTYLFVYLSVCNAGLAPPPTSAGAVNGALIAALAASFMPVSGAHLNPAVTVALAVTNRVPAVRAVAFIPLQLLASFLAVRTAALSGVAVAATFAAPPAGAPLRAVLAEVMPMFIIVAIVFQTAVATPREGGVGPRLAALYIGLTVFACASTFAGAFNPARAFGPALVLGAWARHWVFWTPVPAAVIAALLMEHVFIAPGGGREPNSWLADAIKRLDHLSSRVQALGTAGLIAYGIWNFLYYVPSITWMWFRFGGVNGGFAALAKAWAVAWTGSQVTKPLRLLGTLIAAPFISKFLETRKWPRS